MSYDDPVTPKRFAAWACAILASLVIVVLVFFFTIQVFRLGGAWVTEQSAKSSRRVTVIEAEAARDASRFLNQRDVIRAEGIAEANSVIAESLTDEYIRWYWIDKIDERDGETFYIPTEAGLPITEAGRGVIGENN